MIPLRDENPTERFPLITIALIVGNCLVFMLYNVRLPEAELESFFFREGVVPKRLLGEPGPESWTTLFTSMFLHANLLHLLGNMLYLWIFGNNVEDRLGTVRFIVFYILCGLAAAYGQALMKPESELPMVGASGAISGVLGAYLLLFPKARVLVVIFVFFFIDFVWVPAAFVLTFWFLLQLILAYISHTFSHEAGGVALFAHIAGFIAGAVLSLLFARRRGRRRDYYFT